MFVSPYQADNAPDFTPTLVKRLIGMPGDTLYMRDGRALPQRHPAAAGVRREQSRRRSTTPIAPNFEWQHKIELKGSRFGAPPAQPTLGNWGPLVIPADHYFMMGDNRYCSKDSRYWGVVPKANMRGRPLFVYYSYVPGSGRSTMPVQRARSAIVPFPFITDIRWSRIGHWVK